MEQRVFIELHAKHQRELMLYAKRLTGDWLVAEDIVADAFAKLWVVEVAIENTRAWLFAVIRRAAFDHNKHKKVVHGNEKDLIDFLDDEEYDPQKDENYKIELEFCQKLTAHIDKLPEKYRIAFRLSFIENLNTNEIAERMNCSVKTARRYKSEAIKLLKIAWVRGWMLVGLFILEKVEFFMRLF